MKRNDVDVGDFHVVTILMVFLMSD